MIGALAGPAAVVLAEALKDICYSAWGSEPTRAIEAAAVLAQLAAHNPDPGVAAHATWASGIAALVEGKMEQAIASLDGAAAAFASLARPADAASTQVSKLIALAMLGRYDEALACALAARVTALAHGDARSAHKIEMNLGNIAFRRDRYDEAEEWYRSALGYFIAADDREYIVKLRTNLADVLAWRYNLAEATELYRQALAMAEADGLTVVAAGVAANLGGLALFRGRYDEALASLEQARRAYLQLDLPHDVALTEVELADAYLELNLIPEALALYERALPTFDEAGFQFEAAWARAHYGRACLMLGRHDDARIALARARASFEAEGNSYWPAAVGLIEAQLALASGAFTEAEAHLAAAEPLLREAGNQGQLALTRTLQGEALRAQGDHEAAQAIFEAALGDATAYGLPQLAQRCHTALGQLAAAAGDAERAAAQFSRAVAIVEAMRAPLPAEAFRAAFVADKLAPYGELARLSLAATPPRPAEALAFVERARSRALLEMLGGQVRSLARPRDSFEAECLARLARLREELNWLYGQINRALDRAGPNATIAAQLQPAAREREEAILEIERQLHQRGGGELALAEDLDLAQLQRELGDETAVVEYYSLGGELMAFVITGEAVTVVGDLAREDEVERQVGQLRFQTDAMRRGIGHNATHKAQLIRRAQHYLTSLYDMLLRPIEGLVGARRLAIVPHRTLHYVPFRALHDGASYLIETREVCTAPSAAVLHHCLRRPSSGGKHAVLLGVPDHRAPSVRDEIRALAKLWPERTTLLDGQATVEALRRHAPGAAVLHLACHGQFRPDSPLFSALRLADGWLTTRDAYGLDLSCDLVVLSACETGVSAVAPGDELIGLARGFFAAGAPSLLVSLWTVDDATTTELMTTFYEHLRAGDRPAAALRAAQCALMRHHPHPFFWAPFVLMGRW